MKTCPTCSVSYDDASYGASYYCKPCMAKRTAEYRKANPKKFKEAWRSVPKEKRAAQFKRWYLANREKRRAYRAAQHAKTKDRANALARQWKAENQPQCREHTMRRSAAKKRAIPKWFDADKAQAVYDKAAWLTKMIGVQFEVDHVIPLQSKTVCGLHWHGNLQAIPASVNRSKKNRFDPATPLAVGM